MSYIEMDTRGYRIAVGRLERPSANGSVNLEALKLTVLPPIPETVTRLSCGYNQLTRLPELHANLTMLSCSGNQLTELPRLEHTQLTELHCYKNQLTQLSALPPTLTDLACNVNNLTSLPPLDHTQLVNLMCSANPLQELPNLPPTLESLYCGYTQLQRLPPLAHTRLRELVCMDAQLTELPPLPPTIQTIHCSGTPIARLPELPASLRFLTIDVGPLMEPFKTYVTSFRQTGNMQQLRNSIHTYYETLAKGRNVASLKQTLHRNQRLPHNVIAKVGSLLSAKPGTLNMQTTALKQNVGLQGGKHKTRKLKRSKSKSRKQRRT